MTQFIVPCLYRIFVETFPVGTAAARKSVAPGVRPV
jgi:hypothetical protein